MASDWLRCDVWATTAAGVASETAARLTMPICFKRREGQSVSVGIFELHSYTSAYLSVVDTTSHLKDSLELGVVEWVAGRVGVSVEAVDRGLLSTVEGSSGVCRVGDEAINTVSHLKPESRSVVDGKAALVLSLRASKR